MNPFIRCSRTLVSATKPLIAEEGGLLVILLPYLNRFPGIQVLAEAPGASASPHVPNRLNV
jgi:hypothetical protein